MKDWSIWPVPTDAEPERDLPDMLQACLWCLNTGLEWTEYHPASRVPICSFCCAAVMRERYEGLVVPYLDLGELDAWPHYMPDEDDLLDPLVERVAKRGSPTPTVEE